MKVIQCNQGHYYDADKYEECPTCKKKQKVNEEQITSLKKEKKSVEIISNQIQLNHLDECKNATMILQSDNKKTLNQDLEKASVTIHPDDSKTQVNFGIQIEDSSSQPIPQYTRPQDDGATQVGFGHFSMQNSEMVIDTQTTIHEKQYHVRRYGPVVGWLVATSGPHKGESFELYTKKNFIGRNEESIVDLYLDKTVSRTSPLGIVYNEKKNIFMVIVNDSDQTVYINDDLLLETVELKKDDQISLGQTTLLFVPLITKERNFQDIYFKELV